MRYQDFKKDVVMQLPGNNTFVFRHLPTNLTVEVPSTSTYTMNLKKVLVTYHDLLYKKVLKSTMAKSHPSLEV